MRQGIEGNPPKTREVAMSANVNSQGKREALLRFLFKHSFHRGEFLLSSGKKSDFYIDAKMTTTDPRGSLLVAEILLDEIIASKADSIGGLTIGADPIIGSVVALSAVRGHPTRGFIVRKDAKQHGLHTLIEGRIRKGDRVIIVDDVITTGLSANKAVEAVHDLKCEVVKVISVLDRNQGGRQFFADQGYDYQPIVTIEELFQLEKAMPKEDNGSFSFDQDAERVSTAAAT